MTTTKQHKMKKELKNKTKNGFKGYAHRTHRTKKKKVDYNKQAKLDKIKEEESGLS